MFLSSRKKIIGQTPKSDIPPNIAPTIVTPENYLQIWDHSVTLIGQLAIVTLFGAILGGIPLSGPYPSGNRRSLSPLDIDSLSAHALFRVVYYFMKLSVHQAI